MFRRLSCPCACMLWGLEGRGTIPLSLERLEAVLQLEAHDHDAPPPLLPLRMHALGLRVAAQLSLNRT